VEYQIDEVDLRFRGPPSDRGAFDGAVADESLIHRHAHHAPFERAVDDPGPHLIDVDARATRGFISREQIFQVSDAADNLVCLPEAPGVGADPADVLERIADMGELPVEAASTRSARSEDFHA